MGRIKGSIGVALVAGAVLVGASGCGGKASASGSSNKPTASASSSASSAGSTGASGSASPSAKPSPSVKPSPTHPSGPPMLVDSIAPLSNSTVGVAMPISIVFSKPVKASARKGVEKHLKLTTSQPVTGAWHWFGDRRVDFRPKTFWPTGTRVSLDAELQYVPDGYGRYGTHGYKRSFTIGSDVRAKVNVPGHSMKVYNAGKLVKSLPIDAGNPKFPTWDGTMAVIDKSKEVRMTSCSVGIACKKSDPNYYDLTLPWDVHLTFSGTYVHYSTGDPYPGHGYGSHGCIHLSLANAKWFFDYMKQGDPVTVTGSPRGNASGDNGYADFNVAWSTWLADSGMGQFTTATS